jgi:uncharacterized repeat protein (TIGR03803 family)
MRTRKFSVSLTAALTIFAATLTVASTRAAAQQEILLLSFDGAGGQYPFTGLTFDAAGNLYGTTNAGGKYGEEFEGGTAYELNRQPGGGWTEKVLQNFGNGSIDAFYPDGIYPIGLIFDAAGNLYGTTSEGGDFSRYGDGVVFELSPNQGGGWTEKVLHQFGAKASDGVQPRAGLVFDTAGNLYGTTSGGGSHGYGTVFELIPAAGGGWTEKVLHSFNSNGKDGYEPEASLIVDRSGNLYGTTLWGGQYNYGTVFQLIPQPGGNWTEKILHDFSNVGGDGSFPTAGLIFDTNGDLYSATQTGGIHGYGTAFELIPTTDGGWKEKTLHSFEGLYALDGAYPSPLTLDASGNLYGTAAGGGPYDYGTVFELMPQPDGSWTEKTLYAFGTYGDRDGVEPDGVILDGFGNLYGTTASGGEYSDGTVFEITP